MKHIALVMRQRFVGEAIASMLREKPDCVPHLIYDMEDALWYCRDFSPDLVLIEVSDASEDSVDAAVGIGRKFRQQFSDCMRMLFLSKSEKSATLDAAVRARQRHLIDSFVTADAGNEYVIASILSLV